MHVLEIERYDSAAQASIERAVYDHVISKPFESLQGIVGKLYFVSTDILHADAFEIFDSLATGDDVTYVGRPGFKFPWHLIPTSTVAPYRTYHVAARQKWWHFFEDLGTGP